MLSGAQDFAPWRRLSWGETKHTSWLFRAPKRMQLNTFFTEKTLSFGWQEVEIHHCCGYGWSICLWDLCNFWDVKFVRLHLESHCFVSMVFFKHQHDTSNPEGNLLPQHHFDEASFNPINKNSTRGLPRKRIISKKPSETHSPNNVGSCCYLYTPCAVSMSNLGSTNIRNDCRKNL